MTRRRCSGWRVVVRRCSPISSARSRSRWRRVRRARAMASRRRTASSPPTRRASTWPNPSRAGRWCRAVHVKLVDEFDNEVPPGETGELCVRGAIVIKGYLNRPEADRRRHSRRLVPHGRSGPHRRRRFLLHRRSQEGYVHQRWRERVLLGGGKAATDVRMALPRSPCSVCPTTAWSWSPLPSCSHPEPP